MVLAAPGFSAAPTNDRPPDSLHEAANQNWVRRIVDVVNLLVKGKMNASLLVTAANASVSTTDVIDARITVNSVLLPQPLTANAAAAAYESAVHSDLGAEQRLRHAQSRKRCKHRQDVQSSYHRMR